MFCRCLSPLIEPLIVFRRPLFASLSAHFMQIPCWGHRAKLFAAWPTVNFHFDKPRSHSPLPVCRCRFIAHQLPFCLLELSSCAAPYQRGLVCPPAVSSLSVSCVPPSSLSLLPSSSSSLWSPKRCVFYGGRYRESTLSSGQIARPWSDTTNIPSACTPPHPPPCQPSSPLLYRCRRFTLRSWP